MPLSVNIQELRVYQPFIKAVQQHKLIPAYISAEAVEKRMTDLFDSKDPNDLVIATDFSKMDHHFNLGMQRLVSDILSALLTKDTTTKE